MFENFPIRVRLYDIEINNVASSYIIENLDKLINDVCRMGVTQDKASDLVHDVYISVLNSERDGNGYDAGISDDGGMITVEQFVHGRMKMYSKNSRYHRDISESKGSTKDSMVVYAASCHDASDSDNVNSFQAALINAKADDNFGIIDDITSLKSNIEYCLGFKDSIGFDLMTLLRNDTLFDVDKLRQYKGSLTGKLLNLCGKRGSKNRQLSQFGVAFASIISVAESDREYFKSVLDEIEFGGGRGVA